MMTQKFLTADRQISMNDVLAMCQEFQRHHAAWPGLNSTYEEFSEAGIHGVSGADLTRALKLQTNGLSGDTEFERVRMLASRHGLWDVDLSFINPVRSRELVGHDLVQLANAIAAPSLLQDGSEHTIHVSAPWLTRGTGRVPFDGAIKRYVEESGMIYGSEPSTAADHYFLQVLESGRIYMKYQSILGSRYVGEFSPELLQQMREGFDGEVLPQLTQKPEEGERHTESTCETELALLIVNGSKVALPKQHLKFYADIKQRLEKAGGRYVQGKQEFVFDQGIDVQDVMGRIMGGATVNFQQQYQFFSTSPEQAERAVDDLVAQLGSLDGKRILEPSAGDGALADAARRRGAIVVTVEAWNVNAIKLRAKGYEVIERDFLSVSPHEIGTFDGVLANPPFTKDQDIDHVAHMLRFVQPGGALSVIMSTRWQTGATRKHREFREFLASQDVQITPIAAGAFKHAGTSVPTVRLDLRRPYQEDSNDLSTTDEQFEAFSM